MGGVAVNGLASPQHTIIVGGEIQYYTSYSTTNLYVEKVFGGQVTTVTIQNTHASDPLQFSFDGVTLHGELSGTESITVNVGSAYSIWLKSTGGSATVRVWGW